MVQALQRADEGEVGLPSHLIPLPGLALDRPRLDSRVINQRIGNSPVAKQLPLYAENCMRVLMNHKKKRISAANPRPLALSVRCQYICRNIQL